MCGIRGSAGLGASQGHNRIGTGERSSRTGDVRGQTGDQPTGAVPGKGQPPVSRKTAGESSGEEGHCRGPPRIFAGQNADAGIVGWGCGCGTHVNIGPTGVPNTDIDPGSVCTLSAGVSVTGTLAGVNIVPLAPKTGAYIDIGNGVGGNE